VAEISIDDQKLSAGLYIVATPIGNLGDISARAKDILSRVDAVACEDTRVTAKLMTAYGLKKPLVQYHEHNAAHQRPKILARIEAGEAIALVSDAGTPLISDPGYKLVEEAHAASLDVTSIPGPSAVVTALSLAGLPTNRFLFMGFPPNKTKARKEWFQAEVNTPASLVFYESAKRLPASLADAAESLGDRKAAVCRELTKKFEEVVLNDLNGLAAHYEASGPPKGEVVVVVSAPAKASKTEMSDTADLDEMILTALKHMTLKTASAFIAEQTGLRKKQVYARALELSDSK